ncbi:MAG: transglutaminase-like domain-containing protein [Candidatus Sumerlaeota bacterium]
MFKKMLLSAALVAALIPTIATAEAGKEYMDKTMKSLEKLQEGGKFSDADALVNKELASGTLSNEERLALQHELERNIRIIKDYSLSEDALKAGLAKKIKDFTDADFAKWLSEGRFDFKEIDGQKKYAGSSVANLFFRYPDADSRRVDPPKTALDDYLWKALNDVKAENIKPAQSTASRHDFKLTMTITVNKDAVPKGDTIRCWMPFPMQNEFQSNVALVSSTPEVKWINNPSYPARSLYFEQPSNGAEETVFKATYTLTTQARQNVIDPALVGVTNQREGMPDFDYFTREQRHVQFTPAIKALAKQIVGEETNPAIKARKIYDYIAMTKKYSYSREYSTLRDIPEYVCENGYGDCGQIALLYITLCRASGIPARWESGWIIYPIRSNLHDWSEIWLAPYGWVPVDANYSMDIYNYFPTYTPEMKKELRDFYFGGLDAYRLVANREHCFPHYPEKKSFRSDDVDFQRGELEANGMNIYFDQFDYHMDVEFLTPSDADDANGTAASKTSAVLKPGVIR